MVRHPRARPLGRQVAPIVTDGTDLPYDPGRPPLAERSPTVRIEVKGRNLQVTDELRECVERRFEKVGKQVSDLAVLQVELFAESNPAIAESQVAEATLHLKGVTLRASDASRDLKHSINLAADELARQVKRHRDKRRKRREARAAVPPPAEAGPGAPGTLPAV
jgi:putative sigma-54 modulation protein